MNVGARSTYHTLSRYHLIWISTSWTIIESPVSHKILHIGMHAPGTPHHHHTGRDRTTNHAWRANNLNQMGALQGKGILRTRITRLRRSPSFTVPDWNSDWGSLMTVTYGPSS